MAANYALSFEEPVFELEKKIEDLRKTAAAKQLDLSVQITGLEAQRDTLLRETYAKLSAWDRVKVARHPLRPVLSDYLALMVDEYLELHGDRRFGDDKAMFTGFAKVGDEKVMLIANQKGKTTKERIARNFGMSNPEGYRKALSKMKLAEKFRLPVVTLIDTPGANPDIGAEERGQGYAIAENLLAMAALRTPIVCVVTGEGGSGGALGVGLGDRLCILENAYYSVITPEGCAAILWKSGDQAPQAATALRLTAKDLMDLGLVDEIIPEPLGGAHRNPKDTAAAVKECILRHVKELKGQAADGLLRMRYAKHRKMGVFLEGAVEAAKPAGAASPVQATG
ncbi:MAG: acetyl-CoA carboxylase carboxyltransferase subunit alpha [Planctomycetes bacterium]|nr:acetyl-CoA carboxylase carboxyltransferase subunit alpha [Planctomycetota bacterium]MBM4083465.1 acetyl-CoA carboxylase carboxyltransferase subunit alpha [Planctomycetota bacterium]